jgi:hypothetical protein
VKNVVNPNNEPKTAIYGASGADITNFLLSTNATSGYFIDRLDLAYNALQTEIAKLNAGEEITMVSLYRSKYDNGFAIVGAVNSTNYHKIIVQELKALGVTNVILSQTASGYAKITFNWIYPGTTTAKQYEITFFTGLAIDLTDPAAYPQELNAVLNQGIDIYYQRAALDIPNRYAYFMPRIGSSLRVGGYAVSDDYSRFSPFITTNPEPYLESNGSIFAPGINLPLLIQKPRNTNDHYGWDVTIRQKLQS